MFEDQIVEIGDSAIVLKPTLRALKTINSRYGSMEIATAKVSSLDFDAIVFMLATGAELQGKSLERLEKNVFENGVSNFAGPAAEFLLTLINPTGEAAEEGDQGNL